MTCVRKRPCPSCPYRKDVPSGLWAQHEYDKLREYDGITPEQPIATFHCHATPEELCNGWAVVHTSRGNEFDLLALRVWPVDGDIPVSDVELFASGEEAAMHGERDIEQPSDEAKDHVAKLIRNYPRLRNDDE